MPNAVGPRAAFRFQDLGEQDQCRQGKATEGAAGQRKRLRGDVRDWLKPAVNSGFGRLTWEYR